MADDLSGLPDAPADDGSSLGDHEAAFGPQGTGELPDVSESAGDVAPTPESQAQTVEEKQAERDAQGRFQKTPRHRAKSQQASPADVPRIQELTAKLRAAEAERDALKNRPAPIPTPSAAPAMRREGIPSAPNGGDSGQPQQASAPSYTRPKPTEDEVGTKYAVYSDFVEDLHDWKAEQSQAVIDQRIRHGIEADRQQRAFFGQIEQTQAKGRAAYPDFDQVLQQGPGVPHANMPTAALNTIWTHPQAEHLVHAILTDAQIAQKISWLAVNNPYAFGLELQQLVLQSSPPVAASQRPVGTRAAAGSTGAAPTLNIVPAPRPPSPVRTGPLKSGDDAPDDDDGLDAHEAHFYRRR